MREVGATLREHRPSMSSPAPPPSSAAAGSLAAAAAAKAKGVAELRRRLLLMCRLLLTAAAYNQARRTEPCRMLHGVVVRDVTTSAVTTRSDKMELFIW